IHDSRNGAISSAALDALSRGWPDTHQLDEWLHEGVRSVSVPLRTVAVLARYRRGWRGNHARDALLDALDEDRSGFRGPYSQEIATALVTDWAGDEQVHEICWANVSRGKSTRRKIDSDTSLSMLLRLHRQDSH